MIEVQTFNFNFKQKFDIVKGLQPFLHIVSHFQRLSLIGLFLILKIFCGLYCSHLQLPLVCGSFYVQCFILITETLVLLG